MKQRTIHLTVACLAALALASAGCTKSEDESKQQPAKPAELGPAKSVGSISVKVPTDWKESPPSSGMRKAQWAVGSGDQQSELVVFYFGASAGSIQENLDRWFGQFEQADGKPSKGAAKVATKTIAGLKVTRVELGGKYVAQVRPGAEQRHSMPGHYMHAAIVEAPDGPYYFKMLGPEAAMKSLGASFDAMLASLQTTGETADPNSTAKHPDPEQLRKMQERRQKDMEEAAKEQARFTDELRKKVADLVATKYKSDAKALDAILASEHRMPGNADRDQHRHPKKTLLFFGIKPGMTVIEAGAGRGWYSEILAPYLGSKGKLIIATFDANGPPEEFRTILGLRIKDMLGKSTELFGNTQPVIIDPPNSIPLAPDGTVDAVLVIREMHNWHRAGFFDEYVAAAHKALKPGGVLGVVQHRAKEGDQAEDSAKKGRLPEAWMIEKMKAAGFDLAEKSEINANPKDTKDYEQGVWTLPPGFALEDKDKDKYLAIGESDRMTLKFVKRK